MKWLASTSLSLCTIFSSLVAEEDSKNDDLRAVLSEFFSESFLEMAAQGAIDSVEKEIDPSLLVQQFLEQFETQDELFTSVSQPYAELFTQEEVAELRRIFESPAYQKFFKEHINAHLVSFERIETAFLNLAQKYNMTSPITAQITTDPSEVTELTKENFSDLIEQAKNPIIIDAYATWCPPCKKLSPLFEKANEKYSDVIFAKFDVDQEPELVDHFGITRLPTLIFLLPKNPDPVMKSTGLLSEKALNEKIEKLRAMYKEQEK